MLSTDALRIAIEAVLAQEIGGQEKVVAYGSRLLTASEQHWSTFDRELWAIIWAVRNYRQTWPLDILPLSLTVGIL